MRQVDVHTVYQDMPYLKAGRAWPGWSLSGFP
jgi:hypothetical protein